MKREIKFRAWVTELGIMLNEITLYGNGQMGYDGDEFKEKLPKDNVLDYDYECVIRNFINTDGDEDFEKLTPVLLGEDWIWLDENDFEPMQFTGIMDYKGKEIYEGDILSPINSEKYLYQVKFDNGEFCLYSKYGRWGSISRMRAVCDKLKITMNIIGNIFENPELLEAVA
jgi:uncharacterized phage protein (TIGR01671 family)